MSTGSDEPHPSTRRSEFEGEDSAGEIRHATSWRDNVSFDNPKLWIFFGVMLALGITVWSHPSPLSPHVSMAKRSGGTL